MERVSLAARGGAGNRAGPPVDDARAERCNAAMLPPPRSRPARCARAAAVLASLALASPARSQSFPEANPVPGFVAGLEFLTLSEELSGARLRVESSAAGVDPTRVSTLRLPWSKELDVGSDLGRLRLEAVAGYLGARDRLEVPTLSGTSVLEQRWRSFQARVGAGFRFDLPAGFSLTPLASFGLAHLENDARYNAAGALDLAPVLDGLYVNWDAWASTTGLSCVLGWRGERGPLVLRLRAKPTVAYTRVHDATSPAQEGEAWQRFLVLRSDLDGDLPLRLAERALGWNLHAAWAVFDPQERSSLGFDELSEVGGSLRVPIVPHLPSLELGGAYLFGPDVEGWSLGVSLAL